jgi:hypothetical protein
MYLTDPFVAKTQMGLGAQIIKKNFNFPPAEMEKCFSDDLKEVLWSMLNYV